MYKDIIELITLTTTTDTEGLPVESKAYMTVFADKQSVRMTEFYQAAANKLRPELMFVIASIDYSGQEFLRYSSKVFRIIRVYDKGDRSELICQGV